MKTLKTLLCTVQRVIETGRKALLILPFVSLAREKMFHLQHILEGTGGGNNDNKNISILFVVFYSIYSNT